MNSARYVVIGGGIAGVTCVEHLCYLDPDAKVVLITASPVIKKVVNILPITKLLYEYSVSEENVQHLREKFNNLDIVYDALENIDSQKHVITTRNGLEIKYTYLCLCTGGTPKIVDIANNNPRVIGIRDTDSVTNFMEKLANCKKIIIIGNGGIASELVYAIKDVEILWVVKDNHISSTFIDPGASQFFKESSVLKNVEGVTQNISIKRMRYGEEQSHVCENKPSTVAAALGPDWLNNRQVAGGGSYRLEIIYQTYVEAIVDIQGEWPLQVTLSNGNVVLCDLVISATGVVPSINFTCDKVFEKSEDGGIAVDWRMRTSVQDIFAAGDVASAKWEYASHWFQMKLWSQAHQMGAMAAKSIYHYHINDNSILQDFCFELFTHTTKLFGYQVILLGKYNGQGLGNNYEILIRSTPNMEYIKFVLVENKLQGVILIGDTGLEETCENLILNQIDLSPYGDDILNPDIDIEDYFD